MSEEATESPIENLEPTSGQEGTQIEQPDGNSGQPAVEEQQGRSNDNTVPYHRFKEVNEARKAAEEKLQQAQQVFNPSEGVNNTDTSAEPKREQFQNDAEYYRELGLWSGRQGFQEAKTQEEQQAREYQAQQREIEADQNAQSKVAEARQKYNNYDQMMNNVKDIVISDPDVARAIKSSPVAGDLFYALGSNPQEAQRIASLPKEEALIALGTLSAQIPGSNGQPDKMSNMPNPINPVGTGKPSATKSYSDDMDQDSFNEAFSFEDLE